MNQKGHLTKHQYLTLSEPKGGPWPELQVSSINIAISPVFSRYNDNKGLKYSNDYKPTDHSHPQILPYFNSKIFLWFLPKSKIVLINELHPVFEKPVSLPLQLLI